MSFASLEFLVALLLLSAVFFYLPGRQWRQGLLAACNAGFLYLLVPNAESWIALGLFLLSGYAVSLLLRKWPSHILFSVYLIALVAAFLVIRKYDLVTANLPESLAVHAVSYRRTELHALPADSVFGGCDFKGRSSERRCGLTQTTN